MVQGHVAAVEDSIGLTREALFEQVVWLIRLRWIAVVSIVIAALVGTYVFPVLTEPFAILACAGLLFLCNAGFYLATRKADLSGRAELAVGLIQVEADLVLLTAVLLFSGGVVNPFELFYVFPIIIATIILPRDMSFAAALTAIGLFGLLCVNELQGGVLLGHYPLRLSLAASLWQSPVFVLGAFVAFVSMVVVARYLTSMIITRMRVKEFEAARNHDLLKAVITAMNEGLLFVSNDGRVSFTNPAAQLWKNGHREDSAEMDGFPDTLREHVSGLVAGSKADNQNDAIEFSTGGEDRRHIEARSSAVWSEDKKRLGYVVVGQDLTEHKKLEKDLRDRTEDITAINEMLKRSRVEMAQREKMVAIGQMATGIAHEIGNPLASLSSVVQYLGRKIKDESAREPLSVIEHQIRRISMILKRMLSLSRPLTAEYKWVDVNELIANALSLVRFDRRMQGVEVHNETNSDLPMVWLNPQLFEQVLLNVFINALDAMSAKDDGEQRLCVERRFEDGVIEIRITDTGVGMEPEVCRRAFDSFFTTKEIGKGTGLGLYISYNLITELDGSISMESEPGTGTTVSIRIPVRPKGRLIGESHGEDSVGNVKQIGEEGV